MKKESNGTTIVKNFMKSQGSVFIILLVMCIIASIFTDKFLSVSNLSNVLAQSVTCGIAAIGMTFVILTGGIDLSVGGCIVFSATIGTKLLSEGKVGVILTIISNAMNLMSVNAYLQQVVMGLIIIMAILFDMVRKGYIFRKPDEE